MKTKLLPPLVALNDYNGKNYTLEDQAFTVELTDYRTMSLQVRQIRIKQGKYLYVFISNDQFLIRVFQKVALTFLSVFNGELHGENGRSVSESDFWKNLVTEKVF